ncbi:LysR family transcriptional regulator [Dehalobacter sp. DCM]|uniref:LysR family transcriptional regulator n=1 Tax=Dehalobacter sp. DCM TaxID=2907827 RepID=UPI003081C65C|nr:LysR family transcriptional regulator [Dehalobacter sp. DCM]
MDIEKLSYFIAVAKHKSFTRAAEECHISQTAISQHIVKIEDELGTKLFIRDKKSVALTPSGETFLHEAYRVYNAYQQAIENTKATAYGYEGSIRIVFFSLYDRIVITDIIQRFHARYPRIKLYIAQCNFFDLFDDIYYGAADIGFVFPKTLTENFVVKNIQESPISVCMHHKNPLVQHARLSIEQLRNQHILELNREGNIYGYDMVDMILKKNGIQTNISAFPESVDSLLLMLEANMGIALLPSILKDHVGKNLIFIELEEELYKFRCDAVYLKENTNPSLALFQQLIDQTEF